MILAIASGKGGTGKTTVSVNLARLFGGAVQLVDCDVEEPNARLFLNCAMEEEQVIHIPVPRVDEELCNGCDECGRFCQYHAIVSFGTAPVTFPEMCHGCGGCMAVCPTRAIGEVGQRMGVVETGRSGSITLIQGKLDVGVAMAPPLIRGVKKRLDESVPAILDAPPGTSCPVIATLRGADYVLLVTEPTPFGLHDLKLAVEMVRDLGLPFGVVVNRMGIGDRRVHDCCRQEGIELLAEIPDDRRIAEAYSRGELVVESLPEYRPLFRELLERVTAGASQAPSVPVVECGC